MSLPPDAGREQAGICLAEAARHACRVDPEIEITGEVADGSPGSVLLTESEQAALLVVVGNRGSGGFPGMLIGPVAAHAACPVLVVRGHRHPDGPVVVGVDGSPVSAPALDFAAEEAALRGAELVALHAWSGNDGTELNAGPPMTYGFWSGEEERRVLVARRPNVHAG